MSNVSPYDRVAFDAMPPAEQQSARERLWARGAKS